LILPSFVNSRLHPLMSLCVWASKKK
jgi:hypothetical protein